MSSTGTPVKVIRDGQLYEEGLMFSLDDEAQHRYYEEFLTAADRNEVDAAKLLSQLISDRVVRLEDIIATMENRIYDSHLYGEEYDSREIDDILYEILRRRWNADPDSFAVIDYDEGEYSGRYDTFEEQYEHIQKVLYERFMTYGYSVGFD